jgi:alpha/beta superfamily hydrolase
LPLVRAASKLPGSGPVRDRIGQIVAMWMAGPADRAWVREELDRGDVRTLIEAAHELGTFTSRSWIHEVDAPTSVIVAMSDQLVPPRRQLKLARAIEHSVAAFVDGDHFMAGIATTAFAEVLAHECRSVVRRAAEGAVPSLSYWDELDELEGVH